MKLRKENIQSSLRCWFAVCLFLLCVITLSSRAVYLQLLAGESLREKGDEVAVRIVNVPVHRGALMDRNGEQLAISTPADSIWAEPRKVLMEDKKYLLALARLLGMPQQKLKKFLTDRIKRDFVYLKRHAHPSLVEEIKNLGVQGVSTQSEYKRYYPAAEVTAHILG
jgi:cell division protein FtsI (penicillin-binding protein 3)